MKLVATAATLFASLAAASQVIFCDQANCSGSCSGQSPPSSGLECHALGSIRGMQVTQIDDGCSFTVYTDSSCSDNAVVAPLNTCILNNDVGFGSYSYDC